MIIIDNILEASIYCIICIIKTRLFRKNISFLDTIPTYTLRNIFYLNIL